LSRHGLGCGATLAFGVAPHAIGKDHPEGVLAGVMTERALARLADVASREASQLDAPTKVSAIVSVLEGELISGTDGEVSGEVWVMAMDIGSLPSEIGQRFERNFGCAIVDGIGPTSMLHVFLSTRPGDTRTGPPRKPVAGPEPEPLSRALGSLPAHVAELGLEVDSLVHHSRWEAEVEAKWKIVSDNFLVRANFVALLPRTVTPTAERVNYDFTLNRGVQIFGRKGDDTFALDDTSAILTIDGGQGDDHFQIGQMFQAPRVAGGSDQTIPLDRAESAALLARPGLVPKAAGYALLLAGIPLAVALFLFISLVLARVFSGDKTFMDPVLRPIERLLYRVTAVDEDHEMRWTEYAISMLLFSAVSMILLYAIQRLQGLLPFNPQKFAGVTPAHLAFNTAASFTTNTNWQVYSGESTMSYFTQMAGLAVHNFTSAATGIANTAINVPSHGSNTGPVSQPEEQPANVPFGIDMHTLAPFLLIAGTVIQFWAGSTLYETAWAAARHAANLALIVSVQTNRVHAAGIVCSDRKYDLPPL